MVGQFCLRWDRPWSWWWSPPHLRTVFSWVADIIEGMKAIHEQSCCWDSMSTTQAVSYLFSEFSQSTTSWWFCSSPSQDDRRYSTKKRKPGVGVGERWRGLGSMGRYFSLIAIESVFYFSKLKQAIQIHTVFPPPINCIFKESTGARFIDLSWQWPSQIHTKEFSHYRVI